MPFCMRCGKEVSEGSAFCPHCGARMAPPPPPGSALPTAEEFAAYIGTKQYKYLPKFGKFNIGGVDTYSVTWHWPAFLVPFWWLLYRKLYLWALLALVIDFVPWINLMSRFVWGMTANYLYYKQAKKKIMELKSASPAANVPGALAEMGGVNGWVVVVGIALGILAFLGIVSAVLIPEM